ncbi:protein winged eye isoform X3 [Cryptotermes secundus]|uniref:protein winged eye isoform X3 n=1 Tax=Cryptotermes secundus TaxID=105785 RepID=UPI001454C0C7|nr:protein winged eye isoform X3 [Cryptotermes secundus]
MSDVKSKLVPAPPEPPPAHSASLTSGCSSRWRLSSAKTSEPSPLDLYIEGGGFHQPVSAMLSGSAGSPFRSSSGHRAPWPPPALHAAAEGFGRFAAGGGGGLYSLFPGPGGGGGATEASAAIYSQATSAARFAHSANTYHNFIGAHKVADSLFSSGYTFGGPTPPPPPAAAPPFSPVSPLVERGITQLELMAKGFNNNNNTNTNNNNINSNLNGGVNDSSTTSVPVGNNKKVENKRRSECALYQETVERRSQQSANGTGNKRRWERDNGHGLHTPPAVKSEVTSRPSCGCRSSASVTTSSPSQLVVRNGSSQHTNGAMASSDNNGVTSFPLQQCSERKHEHPEHSSGERKKHDSLIASSGGCSRTNPVSLRNGGSSNSVSDWPNGGLLQIKKEPVSSSGGSSTPCLQVAEVTTSIRPQQQNVVSTASGISAQPPMAAIVKLEAAPCSTSPCNGGVNSTSANGGVPKSMQHLSTSSSAIPVGIAVARQRLQDHMPASGTKPDMKPPQAATCRQQKPLAPAPPEPQCSVADLVAAPAPPSLSAMAVLQSQCDERSTNGLAPWAATASHNPALTPPTLWQYPAHVPVQLGPTEHLPLPPVGYQLVRDPITGHFLLIPATNIEHLQRAVLWPGYPTTTATVQPSLQVTTTQQPATQHIQLFEPAEPPEYLAAPATRILVQPQLTIATAAAATAVTVATDTIQGVAKRTTKQQATTLIKIEPAHAVSECNGGTTTGIVVDNTNLKPVHRMSPVSTSRSTTTDVSVATNTTPAPQTGSMFPTGATTATTALQAHFYYEHHTHHPTATTTAAIVQLSQTPQPSASVQTDNGKRSQATSPVNPAETCLTPPPETTTSQSECEDASASTTAAAVCGTLDQGNVQQQAPVTVQDASNQTDTPPVSEDENCCESVPLQEKLHPHDLQPKQEVPESSSSDVKPLCNEVPSTFEARPHDDSHVVDLSGLELLSNSIEQFENHHIHHSDGVIKGDNSSTSVSEVSSHVPSKLQTCSGSLSDTKPEIPDSRPADEKAAETLQMLCQQSAVNQMKPSAEKLSVRDDLESTFNDDESAFGENCDSKDVNATSGQISTSSFSDSADNNAECAKVFGDMCLNQVCERVETVARSLNGGTNMLGGLGLLCALAEQRFMEEVATTTENSPSTSESSGVTGDDIHNSSSLDLSAKLLGTSPEVAGAGMDVNRNYKTRKSERECKKFIANKVMQYYHHHSGTGNSSGSSSPQHCSQQMLQAQQVVSLCASPSSSSAEIMDAMELNMRMKLAELQRKYREKQRELSKLTPKKSSLSDVSSNEVSDVAVSASPAKRGPGRPRKKCNKLCFDSPPLSPPGGAVLGAPRPRVGRPSQLKSRDAHGLASARELPPPVLEKVTELTARPRSRFDTDDDCAAPKLKASKLDILKPPTLTANRILTCAKFKPSAVAGNNNNIVTKGLKLPQCNVNLVKLATNHQGNVTKVKDACGKPGNESSGTCKSTGASLSVPTGEGRSKHGSITSVTELTVVDKQRSGENDPLFWFKTVASKSANAPKSQQHGTNSPSLEITESPKPKLSPSPPPLSPSLPPCLSSSSSTSSTSSSSKKRKVGRPKKHFSVTGREIATETIVAKKPKSKSSLVGLLLSKSRHAKPLHMKPAHSLSHKPVIDSHGDSSVPSYSSRVIASHKLNGNSSGSTSLYHKPLSNSSRSNANNYSDSETNGFTKVSGISAGNERESNGVMSKASGTCLTLTERKPNKIRPKLKAEAKVKTWSWCEDEDAVPMDWPGSKVKPVEPVTTPPALLSQTCWTKKSEVKMEKPAAKAPTTSTSEVSRSRKRKSASNDSKLVTVAVTSTATVMTSGLNTSTVTTTTATTTAAVTTTTTTTTSAAAATTTTTTTSSSKPSKKAKLVRERRDKHTADGPSPAKKQKRTSPSFGQGTASSESEDIPLSMLSKQTTAAVPSLSTASCQLTQEHLNTEKQRALTVICGLFYAGTLSGIQAPDIYGITLDGERGNRPHIYPREEILQNTIIEVRPTNISELTPGTRVCAYWSQQYRCLYPGTVAQPSSPDPELDLHFVNVEFDDGDSGRINLDDIRLLPADYPIVEYNQEPAWGSGKRRRRNSGASCESRSKDRRASAETANSAKSAGATQKQVRQTKETTPAADKNTAESSEKKQQPVAASPKASPAAKNNSKVSGVTSAGKTNVTSCTAEIPKVPMDNDVTGKTELSDRSSSSTSDRERKRLKKRRREKLKRLLASATGESGLTGGLKKHRKKHRCSGGEERCRHKRHHKRHRKHRHRNHNSSRNKDSSSGSSSADSGSRPGLADGDALSRLSPVLEQLDILEIQQTAIRQLTTEQEAVAASSTVVTPPVTTVTATQNTKAGGAQSTVVIADADGSDTEAEQEEAADTATDVPKPTGSSVTSTTDSKKAKKEKEVVKPKKGRDRQPSVESRSKMAAFLPARQLWGWSGRGFKRPGAKGRGKKEFYKAIQRGKETIRVGDSAVFLSTGRPDRPYIGRIESMWESWGTNMVVRVKWFYHPEETNGCPAQLQYPGALFESPHVDENDVQTISHKCEVLPLEGYTGRLGSEPQRYSTVYDNNDVYYLAGYYDPTTSQLTLEPGVV